MPLNDLSKRENSLDLIYPPFGRLVIDSLFEARQVGYAPVVFESYRSPVRQKIIWNKGRSTPGPKRTNAKPLDSWHQYGLAVDVVFDNSKTVGIQWTWDGPFKELSEFFKKRGIQWLGDTSHDYAHFQYTGGMTIAEVKKIYKSWGIIGVWHQISQRRA